MIQAADEYLKRIEEDMDLAISERLGILREDYRFGKRKYKKVTSLEGNPSGIFHPYIYNCTP